MRTPSLFFELLRASLSPYINHFLSADTIVPNPADPQSMNRYSYVNNNPLRYTDPTGHMQIQDGPQQDDFSQLVFDDYEPLPSPGSNGDGTDGGQPQADVTEWLVGEMDIEVWWLSQFANCGSNPICLYRSHLNMFGDYGKYDIKRSMLNYIGGAVILCGGGGCRWVDYSTPGNIMYGYLSASRGVPQPISWAAAGALEYVNSVQEGHPYAGEFSSWGDNPGDKAAVDFGYELYENYPNGITLENFQIALSQDVLNTFQSPSIVPNGPALPAPSNGYPADYFLWPTP